MATAIACSQIRSKVQNDLNRWLIDAQDNPVKPVDYKFYEKTGLPMPDPKDIPAQKQDKPVDLIEVAKGK